MSKKKPVPVDDNTTEAAEVTEVEVEASDAELAQADALEAQAANLRKPKMVPVEVHHDPLTHFGLWVSGGVSYIDSEKDPAAHGWQHDRTILYGGTSYEHTHEDADGCWIYKHLG